MDPTPNLTGGDPYQREAIERFGQFAPTQVPEPGVWTGFAEGTAKGTARGLLGTLRAMDLLGSIPSIARDYFKGGTEEQDKYFALHDFRYNRAMDELTPGPQDVGVAGQIAGGLLGTLPQIILNPPLGLASLHLTTSEDLVRQGAPAGRANLVCALDAFIMGIGMKIPMGSTLAQRVISGAGSNVALGVAQRAASNVILAGTPAESPYQAFGISPMAIDLIMGAHFGAMAHLFPPEAAKSLPEEVRQFINWAQGLKPSEIAALATIRQAQHSNVDSLPGVPVNATDVDAHVNRLKAAVGMLANNQPVNVEGMPPVRFEPNLPREAERVRLMLELVDAAEQVRKQEGLTDPRLELEQVQHEAMNVPRETLPEARTVPPEQVAGTEHPPPLGVGGEAPAGAVHVPESVTKDELMLVARARLIDNAAVENAAKQFENDAPAFLAEIRKINGIQTSQTPESQASPPQGKDGQPAEPGQGQNDPDAVLAREAEQYLAEKPDQLLTVGTDAEGKSIQRPAREVLDEARAATVLAREDAKLFEVAAGCLMGRT